MRKEETAMTKTGIKEAVKKRFEAAVQSSGCGCSGKRAGAPAPEFIEKASRLAGYTDAQLESVPDGANLGLGCGNPVALAAIKKGDTVLDLGSGAGVDCFLASNIVGPEGRVIGVDMTSAMVERAKENAWNNNYRNVEFRLGEIENLPVDSGTVDVVISNCVINLSSDKPAVFREAFRALKPGGTMLVSDMVLLAELPDSVRNSVDAYVRCVGGASLKGDYLRAVKEAGFRDVTIVGESSFPAELIAEQPVLKELIASLRISMAEVQRIGKSVVSMKLSARKASPH